MSKYNVGDVVKLRDDLEANKEYGEMNYNEKMDGMKNKPITILTIYKLFKGCYEVEDETGENWFLSDEMIEGLWEECKEKQDKLKLIDVLNMIAKGELKEGTKVKYACFELTYDNEMLINDKGDLYAVILRDMAELNAEVELIEPSCEHEWEVETIRNCIGNLRRFRRCVKCGFREEAKDNHFADDGKIAEPTKIEELDKEEMLCLTLQCAIAVLTDKLNEVIRVINKE